MATIKLDPVSLTTHHLHMGLKATDTVLASGTGFVYENEGALYLVTNWHNVTGRDPTTGKCYLESLAVPDTVVTQFRDKSQVGKVQWEHLKLYRDDSLMEPAWFEHPTHGRKVDVVVLPLDANLGSKHRLFPINAVDFDAGFKEEVSDDAYVVGYPFGDPTFVALPIWKRASHESVPAAAN